MIEVFQGEHEQAAHNMRSAASSSAAAALPAGQVQVDVAFRSTPTACWR